MLAGQSNDSLTQQEMDTRLLTVLSNLNRIGGAINRMGSGGSTDEKTALQLIVESAIQVVPDASAVIYTYDSKNDQFDAGSRVSAGALRRASRAKCRDRMGWAQGQFSRDA